MSARLFLVLVLACAGCVSSGSAWYRTAHPETPVGSSNAAGIRRDASIPILAGEAAVVAAMERAGTPVRMIGGSKFEDLLGVRRPARIFTAATEWGAGGADVVFVEEDPGDVRVCAEPGSVPGWRVYRISVNGNVVSAAEWGQPVFYSVGPGYFVQAYDAPTSNALRSGLGLSEPLC